jgi:hypothetical protein
MLSGEGFGDIPADTSEFASLGDEPKVQESMGADVLALLQAPPEGEDLQLNSKQERMLKEKALNIDTAFLDDPLAQEQMLDATKVHVRNNEMKPYRRNNAKYGCSACSKEFFTKEQVEACFFSHPEEGSEEARVLLEKAEKLKNKSAA